VRTVPALVSGREKEGAIVAVSAEVGGGGEGTQIRRQQKSGPLSVINAAHPLTIHPGHGISKVLKA
jgi:hypothetical protein